MMQYYYVKKKTSGLHIWLPDTDLAFATVKIHSTLGHKMADS